MLPGKFIEPPLDAGDRINRDLTPMTKLVVYTFCDNDNPLDLSGILVVVSLP